jgi:hypothetical protein
VVTGDEGPGYADLSLRCVAAPLTCDPPAPSGMNIEAVECDTVTGEWEITDCAGATQDLDGDADNGCEVVSSPEVCNGIDDDGDQVIDENLDVPVPNGVYACLSGGNQQLVCDDGFEPVSSDPLDGCASI